jgi:predicted anti-sigma-YlaC factor YlaD
VTANAPVIPGGISCRELVELVTDYLDGALTRDESARMDKHLEVCGPCVEYVEQVRTTGRLAALSRPGASPPLRSATIELELRPDREVLLRAFREFKERG